MSLAIGIFIRSLKMGGAEKQCVLLAAYLSKYYKTTLIVLYESNDQLQIPADKNFNLLFISHDNIILKIITLYKVLKKEKVNFLFNYLPSNNILGILIGRLAGIKYIFGGIRSAKYKSKLKMFAQKYLCNHTATAFISNSYAAKREYVKYGFIPDKIIVLQNAIEISNYNKGVSQNEKVTILSVGRFISDKDFFTAIDSIEYLINIHPELKEKIDFNIVGYGILEKEIKLYADTKKLEGIVLFPPQSALPALWRRADIFLNTSIYEGMPNVIMEALTYRLPVIATDAGDTKYLVKDGMNGYLCKGKDYRNIAEKLAILISDLDMARQLGNNGYEFIKENFSIDKNFYKYRELIGSYLNTNTQVC